MPDTATRYAHRLCMQDEQGRAPLEHGGVRLLELRKFAAVHHHQDAIDSELTRWLKFFTEGERLDPAALPDWMQTREMQQAMSTLTGFSDKEREYHAHQARMNYLRQQRSIQRRIEELEAAEQAAAARINEVLAAERQARAAEEQARAAEEQARAAEEQARAAEEQARAAEEQARADEEQARAAEAQARAAAEQARAAEEQARAAAERERVQKEAALAEVEQLRRLLDAGQRGP